MIKSRTITRAYTRHYSDNGQTKAYVEWGDGSRTEGDVTDHCPCCGSKRPNGLGEHMTALFARAHREGLTIEHEAW